jgi:hypothetical protein
MEDSKTTKFKKGMTPWNKGKKFPQMIGNKHCVGRAPWNKGKKAPQISKSKMGVKRPDMEGNNFRVGVPGPNKGKKLTDEQKSKLNMGGLSKGRGWNKGLPATWAEGAKNHMWKGGITPEHEKVRKSIEYKLWRESVFERDNWTCRKTGIKGGYLHPHHIKNFAEYTDLRFNTNNGITLSEEAHRDFHNKYGRKNNTIEQLLEFLGKTPSSTVI